MYKRQLQGIPNRCQVVFIGDSDQLPSVGPGAVLSEIIKSGVIPVVRLDKVQDVYKRQLPDRLGT